MLNFRNTNIVFALLLVTMILLRHFFQLPVVAIIILVVVYVSILAGGSYFVQSQFFLPVICRAKTKDKVLALTFDDGPAEKYTPDILKILSRFEIPAAFFCIGKNIAGNEMILTQIDANDHIIGNHSYSHHTLFDLKQAKQMQEDIGLMNTEVFKLLNKKPMFFRPPYGVTTPVMKNVLESGNYTAIGWNIRSYDTMFSDEEKLYKRVISLIKPGAIILFHDTMEITARVLPRVIEYAHRNGYRFERLDKLINLPAYA